MKNKKLIWIMVICLALVVLIRFICNSISGTICGNKIYGEYKSPNENYKAVLFARDCGATTSFSSQISLLKGNGKIENKDGGNIFVADDNHGDAPPGITGGSPVKITWINNDTIQIEIHPKARIFKKNEHFKSITIKYLENKELK